MRALVALATGLALTAGPALTARADQLEDRHAELQRRVADARASVDAHSAELGTRTQALQAAQAKLETAQALLDATRRELGDARLANDQLAAALAEQQRLLADAKAATARAQQDVENQQALMARAAREAYQEQTDLTGIGVVLGSRTQAEIQQRVQWETTIFSTTAKRMDELTAAQARLAEAERLQAEAEARVAAEKKKAAENVARVTRLERSAAAQEATTAALVAESDAARAAAQAELDAETASYNALQAEEAAIEGEIAQRVADQLANGAPREDIARLVAMGVISTNPATYPLAANGAQMILSPQGFIRPVKARPGSPFGMRFHPILRYWRLHNGNDWGAGCGVPLYAAQTGTVVKAGPQGGFGNYVIIDHGRIQDASVMTGYAHQSRIVVSAGQQVAMGQLIGYVGTTGLSTGCHLHLQVYRNGKPVDPMGYIP